VGFEPTIPVFERVKAFYALDRAVTVVGLENTDYEKFSLCSSVYVSVLC
jgi:hypothetical protein